MMEFITSEYDQTVKCLKCGKVLISTQKGIISKFSDGFECGLCENNEFEVMLKSGETIIEKYDYISKKMTKDEIKNVRRMRKVRGTFLGLQMPVSSAKKVGEQGRSKRNISR
jgi:transcription elongation factor Elf1